MNRVIVVIFFLILSSCDRANIDNFSEEEKLTTKKVVVLLYGDPACGKLTVAKNISKKYNLNLVDNHFFNNIIFPYIELNNQNVMAVDGELYKIKQVWFENVVRYGKKDKGFVFTDVLIASKGKEKDIDNTKKFAQQLGYKFLPVKLVCDYDSIKNRINTEARKKRHKLVDFEVWKKYVETTKFLDIQGAIEIKNVDLNNTLNLIDKHL